MFKVKPEILKEFALLAVKIGVNVQKGQPLLIQAPVEAYELVRECVKVAYEQGSSNVMVDYTDDLKTRLDYENRTTESLCEIPNWTIEKLKYNIGKNYCRLVIISEDPDLLNGIDSDKVQKAMYARMNAQKDYRYYGMNNVGQWSLVAYPNLAWAHKVFPDIKDDDEAMQALWDAILSTSRVEVGKTEENWIKHNEEITKHCKIMNDYNFKSLHFKNSLGTDLTVGLIKDHIWEGGSDMSRGEYKTSFNPNIPTEEVFTMPDRYHIDGTVYSTKPLSYNGNIIPEFNLTFKDGKVVDYDAKVNKEVLKGLLETDEGSTSLGEVALISYDSPISNSKILFYETLFDENASCHLALGACYPTNVKGGTDLTADELYEKGGNKSMEHCDFMFGSEDMQVVGTTYDGQEITVFDKGNFII